MFGTRYFISFFGDRVVLGVSTSSLKKQLKQRSLMRTSKPSLPKPYWIMEIVHNRNDWVEFVEDKRRQAEIAEMKSMWSYTNIKRSINAQKLRYRMKIGTTFFI